MAELARWRRDSPGLLPLLFGTAVSMALVAFVWLLVGAQRLPEGPLPIVWDKETCAQCGMHIGDPSFAAQLQLGDGRVLDFDDPGCLLTWLAGHGERAQAIWLRRHDAEGWLAAAEAGFVPATATPMGFGLATVARSSPGARSFAELLAEFRDRARLGDGGRR